MPLAPVAHKPIMQHVFELLAGAGVSEVHVNVRYLAEAILGRYGEGVRLGNTQIRFQREKMLMGTAGASSASRTPTTTTRSSSLWETP